MSGLSYTFKSNVQKADFLKLVSQSYPFVQTTKNGQGYILREGLASDGYNERVIARVRKKSIEIDGFETSKEAERSNAEAKNSLTKMVQEFLNKNN